MTLHLLNIIVVIILTYAYVPQLKTTWKTKSVEGVSTFFWYLISVSTGISLYNLLQTGNADWFTYMGQIINAGVALLLFMWINKKKLTFEQTLLITVGHILTMYIALTVFPLGMVQFIATVAIVWAYVDQIRHFIIHKNAEGTNPSLYFLFALGLSLLVVIMFMTGVSYHVIATELVNITLLIICGVCSKVLHNKNK